jgi:hypothetical protein
MRCETGKICYPTEQQADAAVQRHEADQGETMLENPPAVEFISLLLVPGVAPHLRAEMALLVREEARAVRQHVALPTTGRQRATASPPGGSAVDGRRRNVLRHEDPRAVPSNAKLVSLKVKKLRRAT